MGDTLTQFEKDKPYLALAAAIAVNLGTLPEDSVKHYLENKSMIPGALRRAFFIFTQPVTPEFVLHDRFGATFKTSSVGSTFIDQFMVADLPKQELLKDPKLSYATVRRPASDSEIIDALGGVQAAETTLQEMFSLVENQGNGESGPLLTTFPHNIFCIPNSRGVLCNVYVKWNGDGWLPVAKEVRLSDNSKRPSGFRVFYRGPVRQFSYDSVLRNN